MTQHPNSQSIPDSEIRSDRLERPGQPSLLGVRYSGVLGILGGWGFRAFFVLSLLLFSCSDAFAARIGELADNNMLDQAIRFFSFRDPTVRMALLGCLMLGLCCGLLGTFIVVRQFALVGDTLAHAVLPGIALGYLWTLSKSPLHLFLGAVGAGLLGAAMVSLVQETTRTKRDTALGIVLGGFYGIGILLVTMIQKLPGEKSGLKSFLFGSAAALSEADLILIGVITMLSVVIIGFLFNQFKATSFDPGFARSIGIPSRVFHYLLMLLLAWAVVSALQAVGVVLVSALLIIPAATAYLLTDRLHRMLIVSVVVGMMSAAAGAFFSFLGPSLPTGPFIILSAAVIFGVAFLFAPRHGVIPRWRLRRSQRQRIQRENTLKAIYHHLEADDFAGDWMGVGEFAELRHQATEEARKVIAVMERRQLVEIDAAKERVRLTGRGFERAARIVRNHRLWELYLTNAADIAPDHVHEDAEIIEHILGEDVVRELEKALDQPTEDPHGKAIPQSP